MATLSAHVHVVHKSTETSNKNYCLFYADIGMKKGQKQDCMVTGNIDFIHSCISTDVHNICSL